MKPLNNASCTCTRCFVTYRPQNRDIDSYQLSVLRLSYSVPRYLSCLCVLDCLTVLAYFSYLACLRYLAYFCVLGCLSVLAYFSYLACSRYLAYFCVLGCLSVLPYFCVLAYFSYLVCLRYLAYWLGLPEYLGLLQLLGVL